jgi:hypothetical protein
MAPGRAENLETWEPGDLPSGPSRASSMRTSHGKDRFDPQQKIAALQNRLSTLASGGE